MGGWGEYAAAWVMFLLTHAIPARPALKVRLVGALGRAGYCRAYSAVSVAALALWAMGHNLPNGDLAHALMFGGFAAFALLGMLMIERRRRRTMGANWQRLQPVRSLRGAGNPWRWLAAGALWSAFAMLHPLVIGSAVL